MKFHSAAWILAVAASSVSANGVAEYTSMSQNEQTAFSSVATSCAADVEHYCTEQLSLFSPLRTSRHRSMQQQPQHPFFAPPPSFLEFERQTLEEFDSFVEHFMRPMEWVLVFESSSGAEPCEKRRQQMEEEERQRLTEEGDRLDGLDEWKKFIGNIAVNTPPEDDDRISQRLQDHGNSLLNTDSLALTETGRRMARRLTEVSPDDIEGARRAFLPFSPQQNECLEKRFHSQALLSPLCHDAMIRLHSIRAGEFKRIQDRQEEELNMYAHMTALYILSLCTLLIVFFRRRNAVKRDVRLVHRIMTTIYSSPVLKRQVESEMGESAGSVPPLPPHVLAMRGKYGAQFRRHMETMRWIHLLGGTATLLGLIWAPMTTLNIMVVMALFICLRVAFGGKPCRDTDPICTCCCCSVSTADVQNGNVTAEQACCGCCKGTGICSVQCASCCDDNSGTMCACCNGASCCCCTGYCCCSQMKNEGGFSSGVCCDSCCCCGEVEKADDTVGCCCCCCACCGDACCCNSSSPYQKMEDACSEEKKLCCKDTTGAKTVVYEGIPVQIV